MFSANFHGFEGLLVQVQQLYAPRWGKEHVVSYIQIKNVLYEESGTFTVELVRCKQILRWIVRNLDCGTYARQGASFRRTIWNRHCGTDLPLAQFLR